MKTRSCAKAGSISCGVCALLTLAIGLGVCLGGRASAESCDDETPGECTQYLFLILLLCIFRHRSWPCTINVHDLPGNLLLLVNTRKSRHKD